jgi:hypothetical protein
MDIDVEQPSRITQKASQQTPKIQTIQILALHLMRADFN